MRKFSIHLSKYINPDSKLPVFDLYINGNCVFDEFYQKIWDEGNLTKYLHAALQIIEASANGLRLPETKFKLIKQKGLPCRLYEAKKNDIRLYFFHDEKTGRIIITGGKKSTQMTDITKVINIVKDYYHGQ